MRTLPLIGLMIYLTSFAVFAAEQVEEYRFERYWPVLQQPWYFGDASDIAVDGKNNVYILDEHNQRIQKFTFNGLLIKNWPKFEDDHHELRIEVDKEDNVYVLYRYWGSDIKSNLIRKFDANGKLDSQWQKPIEVQGVLLSDLVVDNNNQFLYVAQRVPRRIYKLSTKDGRLLETWELSALKQLEKEKEVRWQAMSGKPIEYFSKKGLGMAIDQDNNLYILVDHSDIAGFFCKYQPDQTLVYCQEYQDNFERPGSIAIDKNNHIYIINNGRHSTVIFDSDGKFLSQWHHSSDVDVDEWMKVVRSSPFIGPNGLGNPIIAELVPQFAKNVPNISLVPNEEGFKFGNNEEEPESGLEQLLASITGFKKQQLLLSASTDISAISNSIAIGGPDEEPVVFISYNYPHNSIKKLTTDGQTLLAHWSSSGNAQKGEGQFYTPTKIVRDKKGDIYISDTLNNRIVKFDAEGQFKTAWGQLGSGNGQFILPLGLATDTDENGNIILYVVDVGNLRIQKFTAQGKWLDIWPLEFGIASKNNEFLVATSIAVDSNHHVYIVDTIKGEIKKFDTKGQWLSTFGGYSNNDDEDKPAEAGKFDIATGIAIDNNDNVYVSDSQNFRVQQFDKKGNFIMQWGTRGNKSGEFEDPHDLMVDEIGNVYVSDTSNHRIQRFNAACIQNQQILDDPTCIMIIGSVGISPGQFGFVGGIAVTPDGSRIYATDVTNHRLQIFNNAHFDPGKAIIVAGRSSERDNLWDATQAMANFAYHVLLYQGFKKDEICYLSPDFELDIDGDGIKDVDGTPTLDNVKKAIAWAGNNRNARCHLTADEVSGITKNSPKQKNGSNLTLYMVDHGGNGADEKGVFHLNQDETLSSTDLNNWLNDQAFHKAKIIYDACRSGSFLPHLKSKSGNPWLVISSVTKEQDAYFDSQGSLSFSYFFWGYIFNGLTIGEAFEQANQAIKERFTADKKQTPLLNADGDDNVNEAEDYQAAYQERIGNGTTPYVDKNIIEPETRIKSSAPTIFIENTELNYEGSQPVNIVAEVTDQDGVNEVWATINSPTTLRMAARGNPFISVPKFQLIPTENNRYERGYSDFSRNGVYEISVYAKDGFGNMSQPQVIRVNVNKPDKHRAIILAGAHSNPDNLQAALNALSSKGIENDDENGHDLVSLFGTANKLTEIMDMLPEEVNIIPQSLENWLNELDNYFEPQNFGDTRSLVLYIEGVRNNGDSFEFGRNQRLSFATLDKHLDDLQTRLPNLEMVTVIYDGQYAGELLSSLTPPEDKQRIVITSTDNSYANVCYQNQPSVSFSKLFWQEISHGSNVQDAFKRTKEAVKEIALKPQLDDNGDGIYETGETKKGEYIIGENIIRANVAPVISQVNVSEQKLVEKTQATLEVTITTTEPLKKVGAIICAPNQESENIELQPDEAGKYWTTTYDKFVMPGHYAIHVYAQDTQDRVSFPSERTRTSVNKGPNYLVPNREQYHDGNQVIVTKPQMPDSHVQYMAIQLPDGQLFMITGLNAFEPFDIQNWPPPKWEGTGDTVIKYDVIEDLPRGKYLLHLVILPQEEELKFPPDLKTWGVSVFSLE